MTLHCNLTEEESKAAFAEFEPGLSREEEELFSGKFTQYCFYETWGRRDFRECVCTSCGRFEISKDENPGFFKFHHQDLIDCPNCGEGVILYALGRMRTGASLTEYQRAAFLRPGPNGTALITAGYGRKEYSFDDLMPVVTWTEKVRTYLAPGKRGQWKRYVGTFGWFNCCGIGGWERSNTVQEPFAPYMYQSDGSYWYMTPERIDQTALRYCMLEDWYYEEYSVGLLENDNPVRGIHRYLAAYTEYPQMEMAVKIGMHEAVTDLAIKGVKRHKYLNWSAKTIWDFLRLSKQDAKTLLKTDGDYHTLEAVKTGMKSGTIKSVPEFLQMAEKVQGVDNLARISELAGSVGTGLNHAVAYVRKQLPDCPQPGVNVGSILQHWKDYLDMARKLGYDLTDMTVAMPKNLKERHDAAAKMLKIQESAEERKQYEKRYKQLKKLYEFELDGLKIIVPACGQDIVREGKVLHHCVGGYADRHIRGTVDILFLRRARKPETPFLTIEMLPRKSTLDKVCLVQIHGYKNERYHHEHWMTMEDKYDWLLSAWFAWMRAGSKRDKNGKPVLPVGKEQTA